jgi:hypothetical protein
MEPVMGQGRRSLVVNRSDQRKTFSFAAAR